MVCPRHRPHILSFLLFLGNGRTKSVSTLPSSGHRTQYKITDRSCFTRAPYRHLIASPDAPPLILVLGSPSARSSLSRRAQRERFWPRQRNKTRDRFEQWISSLEPAPKVRFSRHTLLLSLTFLEHPYSPPAHNLPARAQLCPWPIPTRSCLLAKTHVSDYAFPSAYTVFLSTTAT